MNVWGRAATWALALGALAATAAGAQDNGEACSMKSVKSGDIRDAYNSVTVLQLGKSKPEDAKKKLTDAVGNLTKKADYGSEQLQRDFVLGSALVMWNDQPDQAPVAQASTLGYKTGGDANVDLLKTADSLFTVVETASPSCKEQTEFYRQRPWAAMINGVGPLLGANNLDSAEALLDRSLVIYRDSPFSYYFKGQIAQQKEDWKTAQEAFDKAVQLTDTAAAAKDSNAANVKEFSEFARAFSAFRGAQALSGEEQKSGMKAAADLYRQYLADYPSGPNAQPAQAGLTAALQSSGDTKSLGEVWQDMAANPSKYRPEQLYDAGVQAYSAEKYDEAVKLMEAGEQGNPYLRAGLFNLANAYWKNNQFDKMVPVARKLVDIDPDNPDNYQLLAIGYQGQQKAATDAAAKKSLTDSVSKYVVASDKLPVKVNVANFTGDGTSFTLEGSVENLAAKAKQASLVVQFIDKTGNVVDTQTANLSLGPNASSDFKLTGSGEGIVAYRYEPVK
jgi:tetratricopeptide (TPR) repeat protein